MKKIVYLVVLAVCVCLSACLISCSGTNETTSDTSDTQKTVTTAVEVAKTKTAITAEKFKSVVESAGLEYEELDSDYDYYHYKDGKWYRAMSDSGLTVRFYVYDKAGYAEECANAGIKNLESDADANFSTDIGDNYIFVEQISTGLITDKYQVDDTELVLQYFEADAATVKQLITDFGY